MGMRIEKAVLMLGFIVAPIASAGAQFTTVVAPPPAQKEAIAAAEARAQVPRDTGHRATLQAMSAWVDSVAGTPAPAVVTDSAAGDVAVSSDSAAVPTSRNEGAGTTRFADGARAPNTASPLPLILVAGLGALLVGAWLLVTGRQPATAPVEPRRRAP
jgi:hypothetical protein